MPVPDHRINYPKYIKLKNTETACLDFNLHIILIK